ncbi:transcription initiation factor TFIID subunit 12 [Sitophilus oryzae]|uniref:Transcription initiation factor TFIID subunit 12 n=1 Tax=Sitophilus oryzae TaxID=7048 RepID=A0A6J2YT66_SITOR|nr:transcription initiation factor TFIID subunit 12 [Sitophilus oryzae]
MQNNFQGQNIIVNQVPVGHIMTQNNGIVTNSIGHENQIVHNNLAENQPMQGVQTVPQGANASIKAMPNSTINHSVDPQVQVVTKQRLQDLVREIDSTLNLEDDVEEQLLAYVDEFVDHCLEGAAMIAKHRGCSSIEVKDVQQILNRNYNMWTPGFGTDELRPYKRSLTTEAHKNRSTLIRKTLKKY